ncbi:MAG: tRNA pseudouridine(55) synthase TruB [Phycisphaerae bacterium]
MAVEGVLNLYKPCWETSAQHAYRLRPIFGVRRVGHAGALDPFADGVLLVCVGTATRLVERLMELPKVYAAELRLGVTNETFDPERPFEAVAGARDPGRAAVEAALASLVGEREQVPPRHSAVRVAGRRAYDVARGGGSASPRARPVRVDSIVVTAYAWPTLVIEIVCGRGTYIRAVARDVGESLGCGAVCAALRRTAVGPFGVGDAVDLSAARPEAVRAALMPGSQVLARLGAMGGGQIGRAGAT